MIANRSLRWQLQSYYAVLLLFALGILTSLSIYWMRESERQLYNSHLRDARHTLMPSLRSPSATDPSHWKKFESAKTSQSARQEPRTIRRGPPPWKPGGPPRHLHNRPPKAAHKKPLTNRLSVPPKGQSGGPPPASTTGVDELLEDNWFFGTIAYDGTPLRLSRSYPDNLKLELPTEERSGDILIDSGDYRVLLHREPWGAVTVIGYSKSWLSSHMWQRHWPVLAASASLFLVATLLGWLLIGRSLRPIQAIQKAADLIGVGELNTRIPKESQKQNEIGALSDKLNRTFQQFEAMFERQKRFTSEASHELRTPIAVILGYCQIALEKDRSPEQVQDAIQACQRAGFRMKNLTNDLLELASLESGEIEFEFTECLIRDVAEEAIELIEPLASEKGITLHASITDATITANGDRLWQVLVNLLNNAVRHTPNGKTITLKTLLSNDHLEIQLIDEGEGIPAEDLSHIFDRFYRVDSSRNRKTGGSGLGLAISETIIKAHGGNIEVKSRVGHGTTFIIRLPLHSL